MQEKKLIKSNIDYPQIFINSIPAPELIYDTISDKDLKPYIAGLIELDEFEVDFIVMICNTIHLFYNKLQKEIKTPILDLRNELRKQLAKDDLQTVTVLGTSSTIKKGLFKFEGIKYLNPSEKEMKQLTNTIFKFNKGIEKNKQIEIVKKICQKYIQQGSEIVILGCTEFAVMLTDKSLSTMDTIDVLVESAVDRIIQLKSEFKKHHYE